MASVAIEARGSEPENLGPKVNAVCWVLVALSTAFLSLRIFCKFKTHRGLWWDDHLLIVAWIFFLVSIITVSTMIPLGFGKHPADIDEGNIAAIALISNVTETFSMLAAVLSKTSFAVTLLRITSGYLKASVWLIICVMNVAMGLSALFTWIHCNPVRKTWDFMTPGTCWDGSAMMGYSIFAAGISALMDGTLALLPWKIVWNLQMRMQEKCGVALAMSMGIFAAGTAIVKCTKLPGLSGNDVPYAASDVAIWGAAEVSTTIMAACIPVLRVLLRQVASSAQQYRATYEPSSGSHVRGTKNTATIVASSKSQLKSRTRGDDDTGSDKSILERPTVVANQIVQTREIIVEFHNQDRRKRTGDSDSLSGYEMGNRG